MNLREAFNKPVAPKKMGTPKIKVAPKKRKAIAAALMGIRNKKA
jgi:hypothetical protein